MDASAVLLDPPTAALAMIIGGIFYPRGRRSNVVSSLVEVSVASVLAGLTTASYWMVPKTVVAVVAATALNLLIPAMYFASRSGEPLISIWRANVSRSWLLGYSYYAVAAGVLVQLLDGSIRGYLLTAAVSGLSVALTVGLDAANRRDDLRHTALEAEPYVAYTREAVAVAHNLRNSLAAAALAVEEAVMGDSDRARRGSLRTAAEAIGDASTQLSRLSLDRSADLPFERIDIASLARSAAELMQAFAKTRMLRLTVAAGRNRAWSLGSSVMVREVIVNLIKNAIEASPEGAAVEVGIADAADRILVTVSDRGAGVPEEFRGRLFARHFTTKPTGSGIGLATSYSIAREHGGDLSYRPRDGGGSEFCFSLPSAGV